jgi:hypothetical protein
MDELWGLKAKKADKPMMLKAESSKLKVQGKKNAD